MTEPQVWTIIGVFSAVFVSMLTLVQTAFIRILRTEIGSVHKEIGSLRSELKSEIASVRSDVNALESRIDVKLNALDRDVQILMRREWDGPQP